MSKILGIQTNFTSGELSPRLYAHVDLAKYKNGLKEATNCTVLPHGPIRRRNGFKYRNEVKDSSKATRLLRFQFDQTNAYILEFGHQYIRFYKTGGAVTSAVIITNGTFATDLTGWISGDTGTGSSTWNAGSMRLNGGAAGHAARIQTLSNVSTASYILSFTVAGNAAALSIGTTSGGSDIFNSTYAPGSYNATFTSTINGPIYITFYKDDNNNADIDNVSLNTPSWQINTTYTESEIFKVIVQQFGRVLYLYHGSHAPATLTWTNDTNWVLNDIIFRPYATDESGVLPASSCTPGATTGAGVNFTLSGNYFLASDVGRQIINLSGLGRASITGVTSPTVAVCTIVQNFPSTAAIPSQSWKIDLSPVVSVTPSGSVEGSVITITAAANAFNGVDVGRYILIHNGVVRITSFTSNTVVSGVVEKSLDAVSATTAWSLETAIWSSSNGYPAICALSQQRLFSANNTLKPQRVWASESGILDSMGIGSSDDDALDFDLSGREVSQVTWMCEVRGQLAIGTTSSEITLDSGTTGPLTPSNLIQQVRGYHGSNLQQPLGLDDQIIYVQRSGKKINTFRYDFQIDNYTSEDLLFLSEHLPGNSTIKELAYAQDPDRELFAVLNDGTLLVCTYVREQNVLAWTKWETNGLFESINTISTGINDEVWVVVNRTINGSTKRYVETLDISTGEANIDGFSDCYLTYSAPKTISAITKANPGVVTANSHGFSNGDNIKIIDALGLDVGGNSVDWDGVGRTYVVANQTLNTFELTTTSGTNVNTSSFAAFVSGNVYKLVTTLSGLSHLEGETVQIKADGAVHPDRTVSSGSIILEKSSYEVTVGLPYTTTIATLPQEYSLGIGSQQGQQTRSVRPVLRVYKSANPTVDGEFLPARAPTDKMDNKLGLYTGDLIWGDFSWKQGYSSSQIIEISTPLPLTLLGIFGSREGGSQ